MSSTTFANRLGITITTSPERVEDLLAIGLSEKEVLALLTGDFDGVDIEHLNEILERQQRAGDLDLRGSSFGSLHLARNQTRLHKFVV